MKDCLFRSIQSADYRIVRIGRLLGIGVFICCVVAWIEIASTLIRQYIAACHCRYYSVQNLLGRQSTVYTKYLIPAQSVIVSSWLLSLRL